MVVLFLPGYLAIALEHPLKIEKAASALLRKLISDKPTRWLHASMIVIAANAGGAW